MIDKGRNRGRIEIMADILVFCIQPKLKTNVMYNSNVSFRQFETYLTLLSSSNLLEQSSNKYVTTEKGHLFLHAYSQLEEALETEPDGSFQAAAFSRIRHVKYNLRFTRYQGASLPQP